MSKSKHRPALEWAELAISDSVDEHGGLRENEINLVLNMIERYSHIEIEPTSLANILRSYATSLDERAKISFEPLPI